MTVSGSYSPVTYTGDGSQTEWPTPFRILAASDVRAGIVGDGGVSPLTYGTDYTVTVDADGQGGTVHYPCPAGAKLLLWLEVPERQELELSATGPLPPKELEKAFDRLTLLCQQLREQVGRAVKVDMSSDTPPDQLMDDIGVAVAMAQAAASAAQGSEAAVADSAASAAASAEAAEAAASIITLPLPIANGGTGASSAEVARTNLNVPSAAEMTAAIAASASVAALPQTTLRCRMKTPMAPPFHDLALPDFLSFSGLVATLLADPATPFAACFGNAGTSVASEITGNLSVTLPAAAATQWLYVERNPDTGALALGSTDTPPEYGAARRGVAEPGNYTGYTGKWGTVAASTEYAGGGSPAWRALDGNAINQAWYTASGVTSGWWRLTMNRKRRLRGYEMVCESDGLAIPRAWNIKVTNNGVQTTVDSVTGATWSANERKRRLLATPVDCDVLEVECLNSGREYTGMTEFQPIFDEDWYSPSENIMRRADGAQVQRVYVGKAVVNGGAVTAVVPFHPGVLAVVPVGSGAALAAATSYTEHNPLGCPVLCDAEAWHATSATWLPVHYVTDTALTNNRGGVRFSVKSGASVKLRTGGAVIAGDGEYAQQNTALVRMIARRGF